MSARTKDHVAWTDAGRPDRVYRCTSYRVVTNSVGDFEENDPITTVGYWERHKAQAWLSRAFEVDPTITHAEGTSSRVHEDRFDDEEYDEVFDVYYEDDGWCFKWAPDLDLEFDGTWEIEAMVTS